MEWGRSGTTRRSITTRVTSSTTWSTGKVNSLTSATTTSIKGSSGTTRKMDTECTILEIGSIKDFSRKENLTAKANSLTLVGTTTSVSLWTTKSMVKVNYISTLWIRSTEDNSKMTWSRATGKCDTPTGTDTGAISKPTRSMGKVSTLAQMENSWLGCGRKISSMETLQRETHKRIS